MPTINDYLGAIADGGDIPAQLKPWLLDGKKSALTRIPHKANNHPWSLWAAKLMNLVPAPDQLDENDLRALLAVIQGRLWIPLTGWLRRHMGDEPIEADWAGIVLELLAQAGLPERLPIPAAKKNTRDRESPEDRRMVLCTWFGIYAADGKPNSAGRRLLEIPANEIGPRCWFASKVQDYDENGNQTYRRLIEFLIAFRPQAIVDHLDLLLQPSYDWIWLPIICPLLLESSNQAIVSATVEKLSKTWRITLLAPFYQHHPEQGREALVAAMHNVLAIPQHAIGDDEARIFVDFIAREPASWAEKFRPQAKLWSVREVLSAAAKAWGAAAIPLFEDRLDEYLALKRPHASDLAYPDSRIAEGIWEVSRAACSIDWPELREKLCTCLRRMLGMQVTTTGVSYEGGWGHQLIQAFSPQIVVALKKELIHVIEDEDRLVRTAAQRAFALTGEEAQRHALTLLQAGKTARRLAGAGVLAAQEGPSVTRCLLEHLERETDPEVRDLCHLGLAQDPKCPKPGADTLARWRELQSRKTAKLPTWFKPERLPKLKWRSGKTLDQDWLAFLVQRQLRGDGIMMDTEAGAVLDAVAPEGAADFAEALLKAYLGSKIDAKERFALAFAARLGDDRIVEQLAPLIAPWAEKGRGQLACWAVDAVARVGSDRAIVELEKLSEQFRTRMRNVGQAADDGLRSLADKRGVTVEEIGDLGVPTFGLPIKGLSVAGDGTVLIGGQRKPGKDVSKEVVKQAKQLQAEVRTALKHQGRRHERMLVNQRRWAADAWVKQYRHPLLRCLSIACCWGAYDAAGKLKLTFRQLDDGSFCDAHDGAVTVPTGNISIGLVHPLELDAATLGAWRQHLSDHEVDAPFPQMTRVVHRLDPAQIKQVRFMETKGANPFALTFRGRADRRGWVRGSVCDGGGITTYFRRYPSFKIDVFISIVEGVHIGNERDDKATLGPAWFVASGAVKIGSYTYDEPRTEDDPRLIPFGKLPPLVWSEALDDLAFLSGRSSQGEDEPET